MPYNTLKGSFDTVSRNLTHIFFKILSFSIFLSALKPVLHEYCKTNIIIGHAHNFYTILFLRSCFIFV